MRVLKYILWPIFIFCLVWIGAIFFGPIIISTAVSHFSEGRVNLKRVEISPKLKINAAVIDYSIQSEVNKNGSGGVLRAVSIDWKIKNGFEIYGNIGPANLTGYGNLLAAKFKLKPLSMLDWSEVKIQMELNQMESERFDGINFEFLRTDFTGYLVNSFQDLENAKFEVSGLRGEVKRTLFEADALSLEMDEYKILLPITLQNSEINYSLKHFTLPGIFLGAPLIQGDIKVSNGDTSFKFLAAEIQHSLEAVSAQLLTVSSRHPFSATNFEGVWDFSISQIESTDPAINIESYIGDIRFTQSHTSHSGRAIISKFEMVSDQYFIGQIENGVLDIDLNRHLLLPHEGLKGSGVLTLQAVDDFRASVSIQSPLPQNNLRDCKGLGCLMGALEADYHIKISDSSLRGNFKCAHAECPRKPRYHVVQTDNTDKFFQGLAEISILSPLALPIVYFAVSGGDAMGNGHILNF